MCSGTYRGNTFTDCLIYKIWVMKIAGIIIQNRNIITNSPTDFEAKYKKRTIYITTNHNHGKPIEKHLKRFDIDVICDKGSYEVQSYQDLHTIRDAIIYALKGACLIPDS